MEPSVQFTTWILPPGTLTPDLRLTHTAQPTDKEFKGWLEGITLLPFRCVNVASQAQAITGNMIEKANRLNNESTDGFWGAWENLPKNAGDRAKSISEDPEQLMLVWPKPVPLNGENFWPMITRGRMEACTWSPAGTHT